VERVDGPDLAEMRDSEGMWTGSESLGQAIWIDALSSLVYLKQQEILHNDIKPGNYVWDVGKRCVKLCDFGLGSKSNTKKGGGTPHYVAHEFWLGKPRTFASDMYSLGICVLYLFRYTKLPDLNEHWDIHEVVNKLSGKGSEAKTEWLEKIERIRTTTKSSEIKGMIEVLPRQRSSPETLLTHLKLVGVHLGDRSDVSMEVSWTGFEGAPRKTHGSTTIPFTSPFDAAKLCKTEVAPYPGIVTIQSVEHRVEANFSSPKLRRSAKIAAKQGDLKKG
jgi:serine/threonine protein kinase